MIILNVLDDYPPALCCGSPVWEKEEVMTMGILRPGPLIWCQGWYCQALNPTQAFSSYISAQLTYSKKGEDGEERKVTEGGALREKEGGQERGKAMERGQDILNVD